MTYLTTSDIGNPAPDSHPIARPPTPRHFVVYPMEEPLRLPCLGSYTGTPDGYRRAYGALEIAIMPLWLEVADVTVDEIAAQRDGSILIGIDTVADVLIIPRNLAQLVRVFTTLNEATQYAQTQNALLSGLHNMWGAAMRQFKLEAEAQIGRVVVRPDPAYDTAAALAIFDRQRMDWLSEGGPALLRDVFKDMEDSGDDLRTVIDAAMKDS
jgi:hypothetical protein